MEEERLYGKRYGPRALWAKLESYAEEEVVDWTAPVGLIAGAISEDDEPDTTGWANEEREYRESHTQQQQGREGAGRGAQDPPVGHADTVGHSRAVQDLFSGGKARGV